MRPESEAGSAALPINGTPPTDKPADIIAASFNKVRRDIGVAPEFDLFGWEFMTQNLYRSSQAQQPLSLQS
jgi:hypothetical protein